MKAVRLHADGLRLEEIARPEPGPDDVLVRVHAAAITRDELTWPTDRLPAIPSYELSGVVESTGEEVIALTPFDRDGVAAEWAVVPRSVLAPKPSGLSHEEAAALPMPGLECVARAGRPRRAHRRPTGLGDWCVAAESDTWPCSSPATSAPCWSRKVTPATCFSTPSAARRSPETRMAPHASSRSRPRRPARTTSSSSRTARSSRRFQSCTRRSIPCIRWKTSTQRSPARAQRGKRGKVVLRIA